MKKLLFIAMMLAAGICLAAANDTILTFSTQGPDTYGDGTTVLDGERYALVWVKDGTTFAGLTADCKPLAETTKVIAVAPLAKGGRCPETVFEIDAAYAATFAGGSFALYLLDTRVRDADGKVALASESGGEGTRRPTTVNAAGQASSAIDSASQLSTSQLSTSVALATVGVYAKIDEPRIDAMRIAGAKIEMTVSGMSDAAEYMVVQGAEPGKVGAKMETKVVGKTLIVDKPTGGAKFFRVIGTRKFR